MIEVTVVIEVDSEDDPTQVSKNIEENLRDTLGHCPYPASITACWIGEKRKKNNRGK